MSVLVELQRRIENTNALIAEHERAVAGHGEAPPRSMFANIRALEKLKRRLEGEYFEAAADLELEVYRYRILNESERVTLPGIAEAWLRFQDFFASVYSALTESNNNSQKAKKPSQSSRLELGYGYSFASSVGVVVTVPREIGIYAAAPIEEASKTVFDLVEAHNLDVIAADLGPAPIRALGEWINVHVKNQYGLDLEWHSGGHIKRKAEVQYQRLSTLQGEIGNATTSATLRIDGRLYAVDEKSKTFKFDADSGQDFMGEFKEAITEEHAASVPSRYRATIRQTTKVISIGDEPATVYFLVSLDSL